MSIKLSIHLHFEWRKQPSLEETSILFHTVISFLAGKGPRCNQAQYHGSDEATEGYSIGWSDMAKVTLHCDRAGTRISCPV